jgi:zinc protease
MSRLLAFFSLALVLGLALSGPAAAVTVERVVSPGGIEAWLVRDHSNPILALEATFRGGASLDPEGKSGVATMTAALLDEGAGPYESQAFQRMLEDRVIGLSFDVGRDGFRGHLKTLTEHRATAFDLLRLSLTQPRFDPPAVERIRGQIVAGLMRESESPEVAASKAWFAAVFKGHPYARSPRGDLGSVKTLRVADLRDVVRRQLTRDRLVVGVVGDIDPPELARLLDATFGGLPAAPASASAVVPEIQPGAAGQVQWIERDISQTVATFGTAGIKRGDPDWYAATVMNHILGGGGFSSRLTEEVREKRGLAYSVWTALAPLDHAGLILGGVATETSRFDESVRLIREQFARLRDQGPDEAELADAKTYLNGSFPLQLDSTGAIAQILVQLQIDHLGPDFLDRRAALISAVTPEDIRRVSARLLDPAALTLVAVGRPPKSP